MYTNKIHPKIIQKHITFTYLLQIITQANFNYKYTSKNTTTTIAVIFINI